MDGETGKVSQVRMMKCKMIKSTQEHYSKSSHVCRVNRELTY